MPMAVMSQDASTANRKAAMAAMKIQSTRATTRVPRGPISRASATLERMMKKAMMKFEMSATRAMSQPSRLKIRIPVTIDPDEARGGLDGLEERFNTLHEQLYGFRMPGTACEIVNLRAIGSGAVPKPELPVGEAGEVRPQLDRLGVPVEVMQLQ